MVYARPQRERVSARPSRSRAHGQKAVAHDDMVAPALLDHVRDELCGNRRAALVLLVLARVREEREHRRDAPRARDLARVDHDAELHERRVHRRLRGVAARVDDVHVVVPDGLDDPHRRLADRRLGDLRAAQRDTDPANQTELTY